MNIKDIPKKEITKISEEVFRKIVSEVGSQEFRKQYNRFVHPSDDEIKFYIHIGDIDSSEMLQSPDCYMLVIGTIKCPYINVTDPWSVEMGEFIVIGNVVCDYFLNYHGKSVFIDGNLKVNKVLNHAVDDAAMIIVNDLDAEFYWANNGWANVGGTVTMKYGLGYVFPLDEENEKAIKPEHSEKESATFLGTTVEEIEDGDFMVELFDNLKT